MGMQYQLFPKLIYGADAVTHSLQKLEDAFKSFWYKLLPSLCVNRNITKEYRMFPLQFQGLALSNPNIDALRSQQGNPSATGTLGHREHVRVDASSSISGVSG
jgi:hypothetical protein